MAYGAPTPMSYGRATTDLAADQVLTADADHDAVPGGAATGIGSSALRATCVPLAEPRGWLQLRLQASRASLWRMRFRIIHHRRTFRPPTSKEGASYIVSGSAFPWQGLKLLGEESRAPHRKHSDLPGEVPERHAGKPGRRCVAPCEGVRGGRLGVKPRAAACPRSGRAAGLLAGLRRQDDRLWRKARLPGRTCECNLAPLCPRHH